MNAICKDNAHVWRNTLTIGKRYDVIDRYTDPYSQYMMIVIKNDQGDVHIYREDRFNIVK